MKISICVLALLGCAWAMPSEPVQIDWSKIKPIEVFVDPLTDPEPELSIGGRIVGGTEAARNSIPYQAAVIIDGSGFCGGSLISRQWVLSAAHCTIRASFVQIILGAHNIRQTEATQLTSTSRAITNHPNYNGNTLENDICVIQLPSAVTLTSAIQIISLAPASSGTFAGSTALLSGWGRTSDASNSISDVLHRVILSIITNAVCANTYSIIRDSTICTSGAGGAGSCNGDSGGPLVVNNAQVGVVSFGSSGGCQAGVPQGLARVSWFRNWINSITGI